MQLRQIDTERKQDIEKFVQFNFKHGDIVQVNEVNFPSKSDMETLGVTWYKRHRSYKRNL